MAATGIDDRPQLDPAVRASLGALRLRVRAYVLLDGAAAAVAWLGAAFWAALLGDWFFEPPQGVRAAMLAAAAAVLAVVVYRGIGRRAFARMTDANMATVLERRFRHLDESLLTAVALTAQPIDPAECNPQMLERTCREAAARMAEVRLRAVFNPAPLRRSVGAALLAAATVGAFALLLPDALGVFARRSLALSDELWPRRTRLLVEGFEGGSCKVARGADLDVVAKADLAAPLVPRVVEVRYRSEEGTRGRAAMTRLGAAIAGRDSYQDYAYTFRGVLSPIRFDVVGGDDRVADLRIEVVESPTVTGMTLDCRFPAYIGWQPRRLAVSGVVQLPQGTKATVRAGANKRLTAVRIDVPDDAPQPAAPRTLGPSDFAADRRGFRFEIEPLQKDATLLLTLSDTDGIRSREPVRLALVAVPDAPPRLAVRPAGIGTAITPDARLPVAGQITDDYGIGRVWFECTVDSKPPSEHAIASPPQRPIELKLGDDAALEARGLKLAPGQKLLLSVKAADLCDLAGKPNVGAGERWLLDVVTPEQLRAMLESRELVLRQRFEAILQEATETRDLLARTQFGPAGGDAQQPAAAEPGDEPGESESAASPARQAVLRTLRVERAMTNCRKNAHETLGVAEAFHDIGLQLVNNRIDVAELIERLEAGIAGPLHGIAAEMFPELEQRLERLRTVLSDDRLGPPSRDRARDQADAVLLAMRRVLDRMIELEDFNEAVELLRQIIKEQAQLQQQIQQRHKQKIRELLEE